MRGGDSDRRGARLRAAAWAALFVAVAFAVYAPALDAGYVWDDDDYLTENPLLDDAAGLVDIWTTAKAPQYYPLYFTSFWIEHRLWGEDARGYHAVNVLLHALNALLAGLALRELRVRGAWWIALLFLVHPVHVESVAWITERKNTLSGLFFLAALLAYLRFDRTGRRRTYAAALALFVLALLSKTATFALPFALAALLLLRRPRLTALDLKRLAPFAALAVAMPLVTLSLESGMVDAVADDFRLGLLDRLAVAGRALVFYPWKLLVPWPTIFNYPRWDPGALAPALGAWALVAAAAGAALAAWRRGVRGPAVALAFYAILVFPALGFFDVYAFRYSFVADHWNYLSSLGLLALVVGGILAIGRRATGEPDASGGKIAPAWKALAAAGIVAVIALGALSFRQAQAYEDEEALWRDTLSKNAASWIAHNNLATILLDRGDVEEAERHYRAALETKPQAKESTTGLALARARRGKAKEALALFDRALELDPAYPQAWLQRGLLHLRLERHAQAEADLTRFLADNAHYVPAWRARAQARLGLGRTREAVEDITRAIELGANHEAWNDRGAARLLAGDAAGAAEDFGEALRRAPGDTRSIRINRALALLRAGRPAEARADLDAVLGPGPRPAARGEGELPAAVWALRGKAIAAAGGSRAEACADWETACRLGDCREFEARCR